MNTREIITLVIVVGAMALTGLDKLPVEALLALIGGAALPSPVVRDYSA